MASDKICSKFWNDFPCCVCLKSVLINFGYDNISSLMCINDEELTKLEKYVEEDRSITKEITCEHAKSYGTSTQFKFLPGHRAVLLDWCQNKLHSDEENSTFTIKNAAFSPILRETIASALSNHSKPPNTHRFSKLLMQFAIYIYIMAGKACYEILCANLPLPKSGTVSKFFRFNFSSSTDWATFLFALFLIIYIFFQ